MPRICIIPQATVTGGVRSFQDKMISGLVRRGIQVARDLVDTADAVLLIGASREIPKLLHLRRRGIRIVQRLDGINWLHRRLRTGLRHYLHAEYGNRLLAWLRARLVTHVVYQSEFVRAWWGEQFGLEPVPSTVIHNGVDLLVYTPAGPHNRPSNRFRILLVEGRLQGGYETGLAIAMDLAERLTESYPIELVIAGSTTKDLQVAMQKKSRVPLNWAGLLAGDQIPALDRSAHLLYSADLNAACPNSVIESLACGLPVAAFNTGSLPELVIGDAGRLVPYGGNPWKLDKPDIPALADAALQILGDQPRFRAAARQRAESAFGLDIMIDKYLQVLLG